MHDATAALASLETFATLGYSFHLERVDTALHGGYTLRTMEPTTYQTIEVQGFGFAECVRELAARIHGDRVAHAEDERAQLNIDLAEEDARLNGPLTEAPPEEDPTTIEPPY